MAATAGMAFRIDENGNPIALSFPDGGGVGETPYPGEWQLVVTGVAAGTSAATIAALILSSPVAFPVPWKDRRWTIAYSSLGSACTATAGA